MRISDWSSDVCSSDLVDQQERQGGDQKSAECREQLALQRNLQVQRPDDQAHNEGARGVDRDHRARGVRLAELARQRNGRSEEHTSELQSLMRISYAVFCLKKKTTKKQ